MNVYSLILQGRPKKQIGFVGARGLLAAVGNAAHAFVFIHAATKVVLGLRERVSKWIREGEKSESASETETERIRGDESVTKEMDANLQARREKVKETEKKKKSKRKSLGAIFVTTPPHQWRQIQLIHFSESLSYTH